MQSSASILPAPFRPRCHVSQLRQVQLLLIPPVIRIRRETWRRTRITTTTTTTQPWRQAKKESKQPEETDPNAVHPAVPAGTSAATESDIQPTITTEDVISWTRERGAAVPYSIWENGIFYEIHRVARQQQQQEHDLAPVSPPSPSCAPQNLQTEHSTQQQQQGGLFPPHRSPPPSSPRGGTRVGDQDPLEWALPPAVRGCCAAVCEVLYTSPVQQYTAHPLWALHSEDADDSAHPLGKGMEVWMDAFTATSSFSTPFAYHLVFYGVVPAPMPRAAAGQHQNGTPEGISSPTPDSIQRGEGLEGEREGAGTRERGKEANAVWENASEEVIEEVEEEYRLDDDTPQSDDDASARMTSGMNTNPHAETRGPEALQPRDPTPLPPPPVPLLGASTSTARTLGCGVPGCDGRMQRRPCSVPLWSFSLSPQDLEYLSSTHQEAAEERLAARVRTLSTAQCTPPAHDLLPHCHHHHHHRSSSSSSRKDHYHDEDWGHGTAEEPWSATQAPEKTPRDPLRPPTQEGGTTHKRTSSSSSSSSSCSPPRSPTTAVLHEATPPPPNQKRAHDGSAAAAAAAPKLLFSHKDSSDPLHFHLPPPIPPSTSPSPTTHSGAVSSGVPPAADYRRPPSEISYRSHRPASPTGAVSCSTASSGLLWPGGTAAGPSFVCSETTPDRLRKPFSSPTETPDGALHEGSYAGARESGACVEHRTAGRGASNMWDTPRGSSAATPDTQSPAAVRTTLTPRIANATQQERRPHHRTLPSSRPSDALSADRRVRRVTSRRVWHRYYPEFVLPPPLPVRQGEAGAATHNGSSTQGAALLLRYGAQLYVSSCRQHAAPPASIERVQPSKEEEGEGEGEEEGGAPMAAAAGRVGKWKPKTGSTAASLCGSIDQRAGSLSSFSAQRVERGTGAHVTTHSAAGELKTPARALFEDGSLACAAAPEQPCGLERDGSSHRHMEDVIVTALHAPSPPPPHERLGIHSEGIRPSRRSASSYVNETMHAAEGEGEVGATTGEPPAPLASRRCTIHKRRVRGSAAWETEADGLGTPWRKDDDWCGAVALQHDATTDEPYRGGRPRTRLDAESRDASAIRRHPIQTTASGSLSPTTTTTTTTAAAGVVVAPLPATAAATGKGPPLADEQLMALWFDVPPTATNEILSASGRRMPPQGPVPSPARGAPAPNGTKAVSFASEPPTTARRMTIGDLKWCATRYVFHYLFLSALRERRALVNAHATTKGLRAASLLVPTEGEEMAAEAARRAAADPSVPPWDREAVFEAAAAERRRKSKHERSERTAEAQGKKSAMHRKGGGGGASQGTLVGNPRTLRHFLLAQRLEAALERQEKHRNALREIEARCAQTEADLEAAGRRSGAAAAASSPPRRSLRSVPLKGKVEHRAPRKDVRPSRTNETETETETESDDQSVTARRFALYEWLCDDLDAAQRSLASQRRLLVHQLASQFFPLHLSAHYGVLRRGAPRRSAKDCIEGKVLPCLPPYEVLERLFAPLGRPLLPGEGGGGSGGGGGVAGALRSSLYFPLEKEELREEAVAVFHLSHALLVLSQIFHFSLPFPIILAGSETVILTCPEGHHPAPPPLPLVPLPGRTTPEEERGRESHPHGPTPTINTDIGMGPTPTPAHQGRAATIVGGSRFASATPTAAAAAAPPPPASAATAAPASSSVHSLSTCSTAALPRRKPLNPCPGSSPTPSSPLPAPSAAVPYIPSAWSQAAPPGDMGRLRPLFLSGAPEAAAALLTPLSATASTLLPTGAAAAGPAFSGPDRQHVRLEDLPAPDRERLQVLLARLHLVFDLWAMGRVLGVGPQTWTGNSNALRHRVDGGGDGSPVVSFASLPFAFGGRGGGETSSGENRSRIAEAGSETRLGALLYELLSAVGST